MKSSVFFYSSIVPDCTVIATRTGLKVIIKLGMNAILPFLFQFSFEVDLKLQGNLTMFQQYVQNRTQTAYINDPLPNSSKKSVVLASVALITASHVQA